MKLAKMQTKRRMDPLRCEVSPASTGEHIYSTKQGDSSVTFAEIFDRASRNGKFDSIQHSARLGVQKLLYAQPGGMLNAIKFPIAGSTIKDFCECHRRIALLRAIDVLSRRSWTHFTTEWIHAPFRLHFCQLHPLGYLCCARQLNRRSPRNCARSCRESPERSDRRFGEKCNGSALRANIRQVGSLRV